MTDSWKVVGDYFETNGAILEVGEFVTNDNTSVRITEEDLEELCKNIKDPIPFAIGHGNDAKTIGNAKDFIVKDGKIEHKGLIFDSSAFKDLIINENYRNISPEIDYYRENGKIIGKKITSLRFVKDPAMQNTQTEIKRLKFSAPEVTEIMTDKKLDATETMETKEPTKETTKTPEQPKTTEKTPTSNAFDMSTLVESITQGVTKEFEKKIEALQSEITSLKGNPGKDFLETPKKRGRPKKQVDEFSENTENDDNSEIAPESMVDKAVFDEYAKLQLEKEELQKQLQAERSMRDNDYQKQFNDLVSELKNMDVNVDGFLEPIKSISLQDKVSALKSCKSMVIEKLPMTSSSSSDIKLGSEGGQNQDNEPSVMDVLKSYDDVNNPYAKRIAERLKMKLGA